MSSPFPNPAPTRPSLLLALRDGDDHQAWTDFVDLYTPLVFRQCLRAGLQSADAEDITQDVLRSVARALPSLEYHPARGRFRGWLLTVTRNRLHNFFARDLRHPRGTGETAVHEFIANQPAPDTSPDWETDFRRRLFEVAADRVRPEFQASSWNAFWSTAVEGRPVDEVAAELGLSAGSIYVARSRVTARLRAEITRLDEADLGPASGP